MRSNELPHCESNARSRETHYLQVFKLRRSWMGTAAEGRGRNADAGSVAYYVRERPRTKLRAGPRTSQAALRSSRACRRAAVSSLSAPSIRTSSLTTSPSASCTTVVRVSFAAVSLTIAK